MVDGVESFFQIGENHTIYKAIVDIDRPTIFLVNTWFLIFIKITYASTEIISSKESLGNNYKGY